MVAVIQRLLWQRKKTPFATKKLQFDTFILYSRSTWREIWGKKCTLHWKILGDAKWTSGCHVRCPWRRATWVVVCLHWVPINQSNLVYGVPPTVNRTDALTDRQQLLDINENVNCRRVFAYVVYGRDKTHQIGGLRKQPTQTAGTLERRKQRWRVGLCEWRSGAKRDRRWYCTVPQMMPSRSDPYTAKVASNDLRFRFLS